MQTEEFITLLNTLTTITTDEETGEEITTTTMQNVWVVDNNNINGGYPIFTWQSE